jgi:translation elongation factor EF-G
MQNYYLENEYYRNHGSFYFYCPYCQPNFEEYQRFKEEDFNDEFPDDFYGKYEISEDSLVRYPIYGREDFRAKNDIDKIAKVIYDEISRDLKFVESMPITKELMHYVIMVIANYIDKNHDKFIGPIEIKIKGLMKALRKDLYWVFEILELFGVAHETVISFVENVISVFLREIMRENSKDQNSPMWGI